MDTEQSLDFASSDRSSLKTSSSSSRSSHSPPNRQLALSQGHIDWERVRPIFTRLYQDEGLKLKEIMRIMASDYGIDATMNMYKLRIKRWGLERSFTRLEKAKYALMAQQLLAANEPLPLEDDQGRIIPWDRVRRQEGRRLIPSNSLPSTSAKSSRRRALQDSKLASSAVHTIPSYSFVFDQYMKMCGSPPLGRSFSPKSLHRFEYMFHHIEQFFSWQRVLGRTPAHISTSPYSLHDVYVSAIFKLAYGTPGPAQRILTAASGGAIPILRSGHATLISNLLSVTLGILRQLELRYVLVILRSFLAICDQEFSGHNPLSDFIRCIVDEVRQSNINSRGICRSPLEIPFTQLAKYATSELQQWVGQEATELRKVYNAHDSIVYSLCGYLRFDTWLDPVQQQSYMDDTLDLSHDFVSWTERIYGSPSHEIINTKVWLGKLIWLTGRIPEARALLNEQWLAFAGQRLKENAAPPKKKEEENASPTYTLAANCREEGDMTAWRYYCYEVVNSLLSNKNSEHELVLSTENIRSDVVDNFTDRDEQKRSKKLHILHALDVYECINPEIS